MRLRKHRSPLLLLSALLASACTVGPDYVRPELRTVKSFVGPSNPVAPEESSPNAPPPEAAWWEVLGDATLDRLVDDAVASNLDLEIARTRVRRARAARRAAVGERRPSVDAGVGADTFEQSENGASQSLLQAGLGKREGEAYDLGFETTWELDVFGRIRRTAEAADARLAAADETRRGVMIGVVAEVVSAYTELRGTELRLALAEKNVALLERTFHLVSDKHQTGLASGLDRERAASELATTRALLPPLRAARRVHAHRLAVLTGRPPAALLDELSRPDAPSPFPQLPELVPPGLPSELLLRRPDLRAAERRLAAATADVGIRTAELYPRFSLTGALGLDSLSFADLFEGASRAWSLGPRMVWPLFQGGRLRAAVDAAEAGRDEAYATYRQTVLRALEEVESSLVTYAEAELRRRELRTAAHSARRAAELARVLYDQGLDDYLTVLDAERTLVAVDERLASGETRVVLRLVDLYRALGGGWQTLDVGRSPGPFSRH